MPYLKAYIPCKVCGHDTEYHTDIADSVSLYNYGPWPTNGEPLGAYTFYRIATLRGALCMYFDDPMNWIGELNVK